MIAFSIYAVDLGTQHGPYCSGCVDVIAEMNDHLALDIEEVHEASLRLFGPMECANCGDSLADSEGGGPWF